MTSFTYLDNGIVALLVEHEEDSWLEAEWGPISLVTQPVSPVGKRSVALRLRSVVEAQQATGNSVVLHMDQPGLEEGDTFVNIKVGNQYEVNPTRLVIHYYEGDMASLLDVFQLLRGVLLLEMLEVGGIPTHASVVDSEGRGIAFVGDAGAGKTSFSMAAAFRLETSAFVTGDKAVMLPDGRLSGLPFAAAIGSGTLEAMGPSLAHGARRLGDKSLIWPRVLAEHLGCSLAMTTIPVAVVLCRLSVSAGETTIRRASAPERSEAISAASNYSHATTPRWLAKRWNIRLQVQHRLEDRLGKLPVFVIRGNPVNTEKRDLDELLLGKSVVGY